jgi:mRNA interferase YafQ
MKYQVHYSKRFIKSLKRVKQLPGFKAERLKEVIRLLSCGEKLPTVCRDHRLTGHMNTYRECHLAPDILLMYEIDDGILTLTLVNVGNHSQFFK